MGMAEKNRSSADFDFGAFMNNGCDLLQTLIPLGPSNIATFLVSADSCLGVTCPLRTIEASESLILNFSCCS